MKKFGSAFVAVILTAVITFSLTVCGYAIIDGRSNDFPSSFEEIRSLIESHAVFPFSSEKAEKEAISGYLSGLEDSYTEYWTEEEYKELLASNEGHYTGIGISLLTSDPIADGLFVRRVLGNSPAEEAGLNAGDLIIAVNGSSILGRGYDAVYEEMSVSPGETLRMTVVRGESELNVSVVFNEFVQSYVSYRMIEDMGYIQIHSFTMPAATEFQNALNTLLSQGAKGFVFDLRNNLGGSLDAVEDILELLIPKGEEMVILQFKDSEDIIYSELDPKTNAPMVVLMNASSASASELMASCLRDVNGAKLIGTRSYGKGIGQTTFTLSDGSAVKMTTFYYLTKARNYYHGIGLEPDVSVSLTEEEDKYFYALDESSDPQLKEALAQLKAQIPN